MSWLYSKLLGTNKWLAMNDVQKWEYEVCSTVEYFHLHSPHNLYVRSDSLALFKIHIYVHAIRYIKLKRFNCGWIFTAPGPDANIYVVNVYGPLPKYAFITIGDFPNFCYQSSLQKVRSHFLLLKTLHWKSLSTQNHFHKIFQFEINYLLLLNITIIICLVFSCANCKLFP